MKTRVRSLFKCSSFVLALVFSLQTTVLKPSYLAPGQIVGGLPYSESISSDRSPVVKPSLSPTGETVRGRFIVPPHLWPFYLFTVVAFAACTPRPSQPSGPTQGSGNQKSGIPTGSQTAPTTSSANLTLYSELAPNDVQRLQRGQALLTQINALNVSAPTAVDPQPFINWMRQARHATTGMIPSADNEQLPDGHRPTWLYTTATGLIFLVQQGEIEFARQQADVVLSQQNQNGSWYFGRDYRTGNVISWEAKVGDVAWMSLGLLDLFLATNDQKYLDAVLKALPYLNRFQQLDQSHRRYGSFSGGLNGTNVLPWSSAENNFDIAVLYYKLAQIQHSRVSDALALDLLARARLVLDWLVRPSSQGGMWNENHFLIGYNNLRGDFSTFDEPTDVQTWSLLALAATQEIHPYRYQDYSNGLTWILARLKQVTVNGQGVYGFSVKPYANVDSISIDMTLGYARAARLTGQTALANFLESEMRHLQDSRGFFWFMAGPTAGAHSTWPYNLRLAHQTPNHWVHFTNPFTFNRELARTSGVRFCSLPERATIEAKVRLISTGARSSGSGEKSERSGQKFKRNQKDPKSKKLKDKRRRSGFIGRGPVTHSHIVESLVREWKGLDDEAKESLIDRADMRDWLAPAIRILETKILNQSIPYLLNEETDAALLSVVNFFNEIRGTGKSFFKMVIPFEGGMPTEDNFMAAFSHEDKEGVYIGINVSFIRYLKYLVPFENDGSEKWNSDELVAEVFLHEILHLILEKKKLESMDSFLGRSFTHFLEKVHSFSGLNNDPGELADFFENLVHRSRALLFGVSEADMRQLVEYEDSDNDDGVTLFIEEIIDLFESELFTYYDASIRSEHEPEDVDSFLQDLEQLKPLLVEYIKDVVHHAYRHSYLGTEYEIHQKARYYQSILFDSHLIEALIKIGDRRLLQPAEERRLRKTRMTRFQQQILPEIIKEVLDKKSGKLNRAILAFLEAQTADLKKVLSTQSLSLNGHSGQVGLVQSLLRRDRLYQLDAPQIVRFETSL